ncbi:uncharacterized protein METZ01_LOCUS71113 [marine metagenome]|uniref:Uncharacterized protein n=1 Tax=marine metagenome TaxID=408172 RepID=A0A381TR07_9ZZZZ
MYKRVFAPLGDTDDSRCDLAVWVTDQHRAALVHRSKQPAVRSRVKIEIERGVAQR